MSAKRLTLSRIILHPDAQQIVNLMRELNVNLADSDWKQLVEFVDAAVRNANETGYRRGKRERLRSATNCAS